MFFYSLQLFYNVVVDVILVLVLVVLVVVVVVVCVCMGRAYPCMMLPVPDSGVPLTSSRDALLTVCLGVRSQVQSFMRGWLCRRKWKIIVQDYICSPHAESMRKRNQIVFNMVEAETEYVYTDTTHTCTPGFG